jgi:hypothetical protein
VTHLTADELTKVRDTVDVAAHRAWKQGDDSEALALRRLADRVSSHRNRRSSHR